MTMKKDDAVEEIRKTRKKISAQYGHDTKRLVTHYKDLEKQYKGRMVKDSLRKSA